MDPLSGDSDNDGGHGNEGNDHDRTTRIELDRNSNFAHWGMSGEQIIALTTQGLHLMTNSKDDNEIEILQNLPFKHEKHETS